MVTIYKRTNVSLVFSLILVKSENIYIPYYGRDQVSIVQDNNPNLGHSPNDYYLLSMSSTSDITPTDLMSLQNGKAISNQIYCLL